MKNSEKQNLRVVLKQLENAKVYGLSFDIKPFQCECLLKYIEELRDECLSRHHDLINLVNEHNGLVEEYNILIEDYNKSISSVK